MKRICPICEQFFETKHWRKKYCSQICISADKKKYDKEKANIRAKEYYKKNKEKIDARKREYDFFHKDIRESARKNIQENKNIQKKNDEWVSGKDLEIKKRKKPGINHPWRGCPSRKFDKLPE